MRGVQDDLLTNDASAKAAPLTSRDIKEALHRRYNKPSQGRPGEQYVCIEEARSGAGFSGNSGQCDFLAINTWQGRGMELIGHEVKVSMADWKAELAKPEKAEVFARFCRRWYVARSERPGEEDRRRSAADVGATQRLHRANHRVRKAKAREPEHVPPWWWVGWLAQIDRQHKRRVPDLVRQGMAEEREQIAARVKAEIERGNHYENARVEQLKENAKILKESTGIDLQHAWAANLTELGRAWRLVRSSPSFDGLVRSLRQAADSLDALMTIDPQKDP